MTVIAALKQNNIVYMGCDSVFMDLESLQPVRRKQSKLIIKDEMIIGFTAGNGCKILQVLKHKFNVPSTRKVATEDLEDYMATKFCSKLFNLLQSEDMLEDDTDKKNSPPCLSPATLLIGIRDKIFHVGEDFDTYEIESNFFAIGSGAPFTLGALHSTLGLINPTQMDPEHHLLHALKTAEHFTQGVKGPFQICDTEKKCLLDYC